MFNTNGLLLKHIFILMLISSMVFAQKDKESEKYSQVRISIKSDNDVNKLSNAGLFLDGGIYKKDLYFETWLSENEIRKLKTSGVPYEITIEDWKTYYNNLSQMSASDLQKELEKSMKDDNVSHSIYGSMGGYLKRQEVINKLDSMRIQYPSLISAKWSIGSTYEGREIWCVRMTNNPNTSTGRPEVFIYALTHAREPMGMESLIYYMYWLLENYNIDPVATYILNNREIYFVPIYNGDGYYYNETSNPNGGGFWRKNRRPCSVDIGVDLNRNYGIYSYWNSTNNGSSTNCEDETYRGANPNSEPETQAFVNFINSRNIKTGISFHSYGRYLLKPWSWCEPTPTPDEATYYEWGMDMNQYNRYTYGSCYQLLNYYQRGDALDWLYGDSAHSRVIAFTSEVGSSFWPASSEILSNVQKNLWMCQYITLCAGAYTGLKNATFNKSEYQQNETGNVKIVFRNRGLANAQNIKIMFTPVSSSSYLSVTNQVYTKASLASKTSDSTTFNFKIGSACSNNTSLKARLRIMQNDTILMYEQVYDIFVGTGITILKDSAENGTSKWPTMTNWSIVTNKYLSPTHSFKGLCTNNGVNQMVSIPLNVSSQSAVFLSFYHKYALESGDDYGFVDVSSNNGTSWIRLATYNGIDSSSWKFQSFDITQYVAGSTSMLVRFRDSCDATTNWDGWNIDNINVTGFNPAPVGIINNNTIPVQFSLEQNYPNPFNPVTQINYSIAKGGFVKISVYDVLGREVMNLVNKVKKPGFYAVDFSGVSLSSGMYFYRLESGNFVDTKKMILIK